MRRGEGRYPAEMIDDGTERLGGHALARGYSVVIDLRRGVGFSVVSGWDRRVSRQTLISWLPSAPPREMIWDPRRSIKGAASWLLIGKRTGLLRSGDPFVCTFLSYSCI